MIKLGEVIEIKHGFAFKSEYFADTGEYILLSPGNCHPTGGLKLKGEKEKYYAGPFPAEFLLDEGDMLVVMTDLINSAPILGGSFIIPEGNRFLHNQRLGLVTITDELRIDKTYLYYLLNTYDYRAQVRGSASGATVRHTSPTRIRDCLVRIPRDVRYQRKVGAVLAAYDDLIENNRRRIGLLEEAARQLYAEWFGRLRFPGHEHTSILEGVPEGWRVVVLGELCEDVRERVDPSDCDPDTPYVGLEHIPRRSITIGSWGRAEEVTSSKMRFRAGDILFGKIRPYFHKVGLGLMDGFASSDAIVIRPVSSELAPLVLMTVSSDQFVADTAQAMREGSKMPRADWKRMQQYPTLLPTSGTLAAFNAMITPITDELRTLALTNRRLQAALEILLPRLMSGELAA